MKKCIQNYVHIVLECCFRRAGRLLDWVQIFERARIAGGFPISSLNNSRGTTMTTISLETALGITRQALAVGRELST
ncbi:hypothetical protein K3Z96_15985, partial [Pseudomonas aeruginosa]|nr:hypothetical protein [Pseudomonas aeruginosa]